MYNGVTLSKAREIQLIEQVTESVVLLNLIGSEESKSALMAIFEALAAPEEQASE